MLFGEGRLDCINVSPGFIAVLLKFISRGYILGFVKPFKRQNVIPIFKMFKRTVIGGLNFISHAVLFTCKTVGTRFFFAFLYFFLAPRYKILGVYTVGGGNDDRPPITDGSNLHCVLS